MYLINAISLLGLIFFISVCSASTALQLTDEEQRFIDNNPVVKIGAGESFAPFIFKTENGFISGYDREIANLIELKTGLTIQFKLGGWADIQQEAADGYLDGLSSMAITAERRLLYNFSVPYLDYTAIVIVNRANHKGIFKQQDIQNKVAAVQRGNQGFEKLTKSLGDVSIVYYDDIYSLLNAVVNNEVDFTILDESIYYVAHKLGISEFISTSFVVGSNYSLYFALSNTKPLLTSIFDKALNDISSQQFVNIKSRWFDIHNQQQINLTPTQNAYLRNVKSIKYCIQPNLFPIESMKNGKHTGISAEFLETFSKQISIPFTYIKTDSLLGSLQAIKEKRCDLLPMLMETPQRKEHLKFSRPYLSTPLVLATKIDMHFIDHLESLNLKKIGINKNSAYNEIIRHQYPQIKIVEVDDIVDGLKQVENGTLFGYLGALATISYQFQQGYSSELKITGRFDERVKLSIATRKDDLLLQSIVTKLVETIDIKKQRAALNKFTSINYESYVDYSALYTIEAIFLIVLTLILLWIRRIKKSKHILDEHYRQLTIQKNKIQENENRLEIILKHGRIGNWELNLYDYSANCSEILNQIFGYQKPSPQWSYPLFMAHVIIEERDNVDAQFKDALTHKTDLNLECRIMRKDGQVRWVLVSGSEYHGRSSDTQIMIGIIQDITERKESELSKSQHFAELQGIFNALPDTYFRLKKDGTIVDYRAHKDNLSYFTGKLNIGRNIQSILPKHVAEQFKDTFNNMKYVKNTLVFTYTLKMKNRQLHFEARVNNIKSSNQIICVIRDVTAEFQSTASLATSERRFRMIFEQAAIGVALVDINSARFIRVNQQFADMLGYTINEMVDQKSVIAITHPDDQEKTMQYMLQISTGQHCGSSLEKRYLHKNGHIIWAELTISSSVKHKNHDQPIIAIVKNISDRKKSEESLKLAANVFTYAAEGIIITDANAKIIDVNGTFSNTTGYSREEVIGKNPRLLHSGKQEPSFYKKMWEELLAKGFWSGEVWNKRKNNEVYAEMLNISSVKDQYGNVTNFVGLFSDITQMKEHQHQLEHTARYDLLTNLPNRSLLADRLSQAMLHCSRYQRSVAVVFLDLDGFKAVNDRHGHNVGDALLVALSSRMNQALREGDTLARIGGDEFIAVLTDLDKVEACEQVLERLLLATSKPITVNNILLNISASIGVTLYPQDNVSADQLMRHADQAMYIAKESGKNRYHVFDTAHDDALKAQRGSLEAIREAIQERQFVLYYQPKVNMKTGTITGVEALIRWQHPQRGLLSPIEFLPTIENDPMSIELGEWVIDEALQQISNWQKMGLNLSINTSVNISATQLQQPGFTQRLSSLLLAHPDVAPQYLELEVLETSALADLNTASNTMNECIKLGVKFSIDDFGTGYSSLTYLRRLPASLIKIDQSFVRDMLDDVDDLAIVEGVIALAKSFKRDVIAEGVETIEHGSALLELGCELAQGYGIAKPMPADDIPAWIINWKPDASWSKK